jgi:hypothetical protein
VKDLFRQRIDLDRLCADIASAADIAGAPYDSVVTREVLNAYRNFYSGAPVTFGTSTRDEEERRLSVRYMELQIPHDPYYTALAREFVSLADHPVYDLIPEIRSRFPMRGYGVNLDVSCGLTKIWPFISPQPLEYLFGLSCMPESIKALGHYFYNHRLDIVNMLALDFRAKTVDVFFSIENPGEFNRERIASMIEEPGFKAAGKKIREYCTRAITLYYTFRWDSPGIEKICFAMPAYDPDLVPTHLHPLLENYTDRVPILGDTRKFIFSIAFDRKGNYIEIENDYTGTMLDLFVNAAGGPGAREDY